MGKALRLLIIILALSSAALPPRAAQALDYPYPTAEPQKTGWPLTDEETRYVLKPEHARRPGSEQNKHLPAMWPVTPSAGNWGGASWLDTHAKLVDAVKANQGPVDILLVGDSITQQWGAAWPKHFGQYKSVNIGIGGDKTQNVLWRLDHGGAAGLEPRLVVLLIGNNNMFFTAETGIEPAAQGIKMCAANLREKFPKAELVVVKIFPAHAPGNKFYEDIKKTNAALDTLKLDADPKVHLLDLWNEMVTADGALKPGLFSPDNIHLTQGGGYELYASKLKPLVEKLLGGKGSAAPDYKPAAAAKPAAAPARRSAGDHYLLLNYVASLNNPGQSAEIMTYVKEKFGAANRTSSIKVGVAVIYTPGDHAPQCVQRMLEDLALAQRLNVPILIQVDTENWLPVSLLNWYDPAKPGYDPAKTADVEWYGWSPDKAVKLCWRNWGVQVRTGPQPNLLSPNFQAWEKKIYAAFLPAAAQWQESLPPDQKWLFVGWKCGWETTLNSQYAYFENGNSYYGRTDNPAWDQKKIQVLGYNAARTAGLKTSGELNFKETYGVFMKIVGKHLTYLAEMACEAGIPKGKVFVHSIAQGVDSYNMDELVNPYSNPAVSFYGPRGKSMQSNASFMRAVHAAQDRHGATGYGYGEFNLHTTDYRVWHDWFTNNLHGDPDCVFQALYNYDSMKGKPTVEQAMLDAMAACPAAQSPRN